MKEDIIAIFQELYEAESFVKSFNAYFLVLIVMLSGTRDIKDFRPINLVGSIYKLIAKVIARRITKGHR